jgi:hypothetical protein
MIIAAYCHGSRSNLNNAELQHCAPPRSWLQFSLQSVRELNAGDRS